MRAWLPDATEQRAIADYLDRATARLDALVAAKERLLDLLAEKRRALITRAVTRGLAPNVPLRDSGIPWLGEIPAHWEVTLLRFACCSRLRPVEHRRSITWMIQTRIVWTGLLLAILEAISFSASRCAGSPKRQCHQGRRSYSRLVLCLL